MGRYDKIRYWNGSSWVQPNQVRIWNGSSWTDYGTNDSGNTNSIYVWDGSNWQRKTLNRTSHTVVDDHYLQYNGGAATTISDGFQFYNAKYEFIVQPDSQGNYMMFETGTSDKNCYARFGFYKSGNYYVYGKSRYNGGTAYEANTSSIGSLAAGVKYKITYISEKTDAITVYNYSTGATWKASAEGRGRFFNWKCDASMFNGCLITDRNLYGKVWYAYLKGCKSNETNNSVTYNLSSSSAGSSTLKFTSQDSSGGVAAGDITHYGTIVDVTHVEYTWD